MLSFSYVADLLELSEDLVGTKEEPGMSTIYNRIACHLCDKNFLTSASLRYHVRTTHQREPDIKALTCYICLKVFKTPGVLRRHLDVHRGLRPFKCETCGKHFNRRLHLAVHVSTHLTDNNPVICDICHKVFSTSKYLNQHKQIHLKENYVCGDCGKVCTSVRYLNQHKQINSKTDESFVCNVCGKGFASIACLNHHVDYVHPDARPFKCDECDETFTKWFIREGHHNAVHRKRISFKPECGKNFKENYDLIRRVPSLALSNGLGRCQAVKTGRKEMGLKSDPKLANSDVWPKVVLSRTLTDAIFQVSRLDNGAGSFLLM